MLSRVGQKDGARAAFERAADLAVTRANRNLLALQIGELADN
jgi:predicted RNA polymerase sigma factor